MPLKFPSRWEKLKPKFVKIGDTEASRLRRPQIEVSQALLFCLPFAVGLVPVLLTFGFPDSTTWLIPDHWLNDPATQRPYDPFASFSHAKNSMNSINASNAINSLSTLRLNDARTQWRVNPINPSNAMNAINSSSTQRPYDSTPRQRYDSMTRWLYKRKWRDKHDKPVFDSWIPVFPLTSIKPKSNLLY